jgi:hypothetical protein
MAERLSKLEAMDDFQVRQVQGTCRRKIHHSSSVLFPNFCTRTLFLEHATPCRLVRNRMGR